MNFRLGATLKNFFSEFLKGTLILRVDKYFPHILYTFALFWLMIILNIFIEGTLSKVEKNREQLAALKIYHSQKIVEMVSLNRVSTVERLLKEKGSDVTLPEKPAAKIAAKEK